MKLTVLCLCFLHLALVSCRLFTRNDLQAARSNVSDGGGPAPRSTDTMEPSVPLHKANIKFCLAFLTKLSENDKTANILFSPLSISAAMAMVMLGAKGKTAAQMSEVLGFTEEKESQPAEEEPKPTGTSSRQPLCQLRRQAHTQKQQQQQQQQTRLPDYLLKILKSQTGQDVRAQTGQDARAQTGQDDVHAQTGQDAHAQTGQDDVHAQTGQDDVHAQTGQDAHAQTGQDDVHAQFEKLLTELNKSDALSLANRLYGEQSYEFLKEFLEKAKKYYDAEPETVDFINSSPEARVKINSWVEKQTQDKIKDLLEEDAVDSATRLVLVNAINFKGKWDEQFKKEDTSEVQFKINKIETKAVQMMHQKRKFSVNAIPEVGAKVLVMPYVEKKLSMIIILPDEIEDDTTGLEKLERELTLEKFEEWTNSDRMKTTEVELSVPRFKMEETCNLKDVLISMGMVLAFDITMSDFSGMSPGNDLVVSKAVHKSYVEVNEEGTEAAAATGAVMSERGAIIRDKLNADHPFLFFIRHNCTGTILFAGRFCSPE